MKIKVCGLRDEHNIRQLMEAVHPDYTGFIFYEASPRYAGEKLDPLFLRRLKGSFRKTGVFVDAPLERAKRVCGEYELNAVQLHGQESPEYCGRLQGMDLQVIKTFHLTESFNFHMLEDYAPVCDLFLFDTRGSHPGGNGVHFNWALLDHYHLSVPFLLSGGLSESDAKAISAIRHPALAGVDINSRFERQPGYKDVKSIQLFVNQLNKYVHGNKNL